MNGCMYVYIVCIYMYACCCNAKLFFYCRRSDLVLSTKIFFGVKSGPNTCGLSRKHIVEGMNASLARMQLSYVDLVFCHRPDLRTPIEETVRAMNHVIEKGQVLRVAACVCVWSCVWYTETAKLSSVTEGGRV